MSTIPVSGGGTTTVTRLVVGLAAAALLFQCVHTIEHLAQSAYWLAHPLEAPWLTPWAEVGRDVLSAGARGAPAGGAELLHLIGNLIFLLGLVAATVAARRLERDRPASLRHATVLQALHVAEHLALTVTWYATGTAAGVTTLLGTAEGPGAAALRVWSHLLINTVATGLTLLGLHAMRKKRPRNAERSDGSHRRRAPTDGALAHRRR